MIKLFLTLPGESEAEYTSLLCGDYSYTQDGFGAELKSVRNSCDLEILYNSLLIQSLLSASGHTLARLMEDSTTIFQGVLAPLDGLSIERGSPSLSIRINDLNDLLDIPCPDNLYISSGHLSNPSNQANSVLHQLLAGITAIDLSLLPNLSSGSTLATFAPVEGFKGEGTRFDSLVNALASFGFYHYFEGNKLRIASYTKSTSVIDYALTDDDTINGTVSVQVRDSDKEYDSIKVHYSKLINETGKLVGVLPEAIIDPVDNVDYTPSFKADLDQYYYGLTTVAYDFEMTGTTYANRRADYLSGAVKPRYTPRFIKHNSIDPYPVNMRLNWDSLPSEAEIINYSNFRYDFNLIWAYPHVAINPTKALSMGYSPHSDKLTKVSESVDQDGNLATIFRLRPDRLTAEYTRPKSGIFGLFAEVRELQEIVFCVANLKVKADLKIRAKGGTITIEGAKKKYKEITLKNVYSKSIAQAYANFYSQYVLGGGSTLSFDSYYNYDINKTMSYTSGVSGLSFTGLLCSKSYNRATRKYSYSAILTGDIALVDEVDYAQPDYTIPDNSSVFEVMEQVIDGSGRLTAPIESVALPPTNPEATGLYFGNDKFGYYDNETGAWPVEITSAGDAKFAGEIQSSSGNIGGWDIGPNGIISANGNIRLNPADGSIVAQNSAFEIRALTSFADGVQAPLKVADKFWYGSWGSPGTTGPGYAPDTSPSIITTYKISNSLYGIVIKWTNTTNSITYLRLGTYDGTTYTIITDIVYSLGLDCPTLYTKVYTNCPFGVY